MSYRGSITEYGKPLDDSYLFDQEEDFGTERARCKCGRFFRRDVARHEWQEVTACPACIDRAYGRNGAK